MNLSTDRVLAGIAGILAVLALLGIGAEPVTMLAIAVILLVVMVFI